jgi:glycosyltransferase involved in cell wall biosynthesis
MNECDLNEDIQQYPIKRIFLNNPALFWDKNQLKFEINEDQIQFDDNFVNTYFDKVYCINLNQRIAKWLSVKRRLNACNVDAIRFNAIDGELFSGESNLSSGEYGCLLSHLSVIRDAKANNYHRILIFEDDVHLSKDFQKRIQLLQKIDWKLLYLGGSQYDWENINPSEGGFYLSKDTRGTFAYAVDRSMFDELESEFLKKYAPVDIILTDVQGRHYGECYTFYPNIALADVRTSDIRGERDMASHSKKMRWNLSNFPAFDPSTKKILLVPDARDWAFDNIVKAVIKYNPYPEKLYYETVYSRDLHSKISSYNNSDWDYVYVMFEGERIIPSEKNVIRGCYSAFWSENELYTPKYMCEYFSGCGGAVFANEALKEQFLKHLPKNFPTETITDASDENLFYPIKHKKNKEFTVLYVGNTLRLIKNFETVKKICNESQVTLNVCEDIPNNEMVHEYNKADVVINFSEFEGGPQTFVEAALCEVPMLIRDTNQLAKHIPCFVGSTAEDFVNILNRLKTNREECVKKGEEAYKVAIEQFTYKRTAKKFADFFLSFGKKNLRDELTVFVINAGDNPNYWDCVDSVYNQNCTFHIKFINNVAPMSKAFQRMIDDCFTKYYIQVDGDMILNPDAIETIYNSLVSSEEKTSIVAYMLKDVHLDFDIYGIKGYKHDVLKNYPYNLETISCEMEQIKRMHSGGYNTAMKQVVLGYHSPKWNLELIYERYFDLMEKWKIYKYDWLEKLPAKLLIMFKNNPSDINFFALAGTMESLFNKDPIRKREKDFSIKNASAEMLQKMYL